MKILIVCQYYYPENFVISNISSELVKKGHDVTVLTAKPNYGFGKIVEGYENISYEEIDGVKVHRVNIYPRKNSRLSIIKNYLSFWRNSKKWVRNCKEKYDIVYSMSLSPVTILSAGNLYKKKHKIKHVVHCVDLWPESVLITHAVKRNSIFYKVLYKWSRKLYSQVDKVLISSPSFKQYFETVLKLSVDNISYLPQPSLHSDSDLKPFEYKKKFNILYCGNLGIIQLIDLIPEVMKEIDNPNICFNVIGMGPKTDSLVNKIKQYGLEDKLVYHGPIASKQACAYFKSADVLYVSLSKDGYVGKTIPNKLMMSMAFAKPIIGVLSGDGRDVLNASKGGIVCDENINEIKNAITSLYEMSIEERKNLGELNKVYYQDHFSLDIVVDSLESFLK